MEKAKELGDANVGFSTDTISASPTKSELTTIFGEPNNINNGLAGIVDSGGTATNVYSIWVMDGEFYWEKLTKAV